MDWGVGSCGVVRKINNFAVTVRPMDKSIGNGRELTDDNSLLLSFQPERSSKFVKVVSLRSPDNKSGLKQSPE